MTDKGEGHSPNVNVGQRLSTWPGWVFWLINVGKLGLQLLFAHFRIFTLIFKNICQSQWNIKILNSNNKNDITGRVVCFAKNKRTTRGKDGRMGLNMAKFCQRRLWMAPFVFSSFFSVFYRVRVNNRAFHCLVIKFRNW